MEDFRALTVDSIQAGLRARRFSARALAREALRLAAMKLPIQTRVVVREDW